MKRITKIVMLLIISLVTSYTIYCSDYQFVGSKNSNKYHYPSCRWAQKIKTGNMVMYISVSDARGKYKIPCKVCKPPISDSNSSTTKTSNIKASTKNKVYCGDCDVVMPKKFSFCGYCGKRLS